MLLTEIKRIDNWTNVVADNGLFDKQKKIPANSFEDIQDHLKKARKCLDAGDLEESDYHPSFDLRAYDKAMYNSSRVWRFSNIYAEHLCGFI